jgi:hypothetical protein
MTTLWRQLSPDYSINEMRQQEPPTTGEFLELLDAVLIETPARWDAEPGIRRVLWLPLGSETGFRDALAALRDDDGFIAWRGRADLTSPGLGDWTVSQIDTYLSHAAGNRWSKWRASKIDPASGINAEPRASGDAS